MFKVLFTSDYEIHGSGMGSPRDLVLDPTTRMLDQFDRHGAKLTIMADTGELLKFKEYRDANGVDRFAWDGIAAQLARVHGHTVPPGRHVARQGLGADVSVLARYRGGPQQHTEHAGEEPS